MQVSGEPVFTDGESQLLFLRWNATQLLFRSVAMSEGRMRIEQRNGESWVLPGGEGLASVRRVDGVLKRSPRNPAQRLTYPQPGKCVTSGPLAAYRVSSRSVGWSTDFPSATPTTGVRSEIKDQRKIEAVMS